MSSIAQNARLVRACRYGAVKAIPLLHGPLPDALFVTIHHWPAPGLSVTLGVRSEVRRAVAEPRSRGSSHHRIRPPELSSTHSRYCAALATAVHVNVGVDVAMLPVGATRVAGPGGGVPATV